jgi:hypothetical protein
MRKALPAFITVFLIAAMPVATADAARTQIFSGTPLAGPVISGDRAIVGERGPQDEFELVSLGAGGGARALGSFGTIPVPPDLAAQDNGFYKHLRVTVPASPTLRPDCQRTESVLRITNLADRRVVTLTRR